jgi:uncharacterized membrane protein YphA (DoxX/SURF4 family)
MATGPEATRPPRRAVGRFVRRVAPAAVSVIVYVFLFFVCQRMFGGYPQYYTDILTIIAVILIALTGGVAWILDERRIDADG